MLWFVGVAIFAYLVSILSITPVLVKAQQGGREKPSKMRVFFVAWIAVLTHFASLYYLFFNVAGGDGQNFSLLNVASLVVAVVAMLMTLAIWWVNTLWFILPVVYILAILSLCFSVFIPTSFIKHLIENPGLLLHIFLSLVSYAVFLISMLYAIQLSWLDYNLKTKRTALSPVLPPLMRVEKQFFGLVWLAESLLTFALVSGAIYLPEFFFADQIQKAVFSFVAWIVFAILLYGHHLLHWRGKKLLIYMVSGMSLLTFAYFGSRLGL
ncbi:ABC transporter permease [Mergibacter septicus]|uniref:cytochrome C assembly family protein n=1 Tax=Mergibacter septicus TaxID=221402 RepID=UPI0011790EDA|nr:cytochrome c biogenesis protein CcsA [Mergibacter septicus]AWX14002.1 ABC transporter permease [Mergibacter septicus]